MIPRGKLFAVDAGGLAPGVMTESDELESGFLVVADVVGAAEKIRVAKTETLRDKMLNQTETQAGAAERGLDSKSAELRR